jgi:hypothetical protein
MTPYEITVLALVVAGLSLVVAGLVTALAWATAISSARVARQAREDAKTWARRRKTAAYAAEVRRAAAVDTTTTLPIPKVEGDAP